MSWWNEEKIRFYSRAAKEGNFHSFLASIIKRHVKEKETIAELGCGLGFLAHELGAVAYDNDVMATAYVKAHFPELEVVTADCFSLEPVADVCVACFFGRITEEDNFQRMIRTCRKRLVYIVSEHCDADVCNWDAGKKVEAFLRGRNIGYTMERHSLPFDQRFASDEEKDEFIRVNYTDRGREFRRRIEYTENGPVMRNDKAFSLFVIEREQGGIE